MQEMGVIVSGPGDFHSASLPPVTVLPAICNLDVTTLCALISEVSHGDPLRPALQHWAQRVTHWKVTMLFLPHYLLYIAHAT